MRRSRRAGVRWGSAGVVAVLLILVGCTQLTQVDRLDLQGTWVGYFSLAEGNAVYNVANATTIVIHEDLSTELTVVASAQSMNWGPWTVTVTGSPVISSTEGLLGEVTVTRYRAGLDTLTAIATWSGQFDTVQNYVSGEWSINPGQAFFGEGKWAGTPQAR